MIYGSVSAMGDSTADGQLTYDGTGKANSLIRSTGPLAHPFAFNLSSRSSTVFLMYGSIL
jgi:hypothetical protein